MADRLSIGDVAVLTGLGIDTLRYYDRVGLASPGRDSAGRRWYTEGDTATLAVIRQFRGIGLSLAQIRTLVEIKQRGGPSSVRLAAAEAALRDIQATIERRRAELTEAATTVEGWLAEIVEAVIPRR